MPADLVFAPQELWSVPADLVFVPQELWSVGNFVFVPQELWSAADLELVFVPLELLFWGWNNPAVGLTPTSPFLTLAVQHHAVLV